MSNIFSDISNDFFKGGEITRTGDGNPSGFTDLANLPPSSAGNVRQAQIQNQREATVKRNLVRWFLPETGIIEMYINPQSIKYSDKKHISPPTRTRGGYIIQYWGEELGTLSIAGTTGSSGVEGINVLYDIYRNEQVAMDSLAQAYEAAREEEISSGGLLENVIGSDSLLGGVSTLVGAGASAAMEEVQNVLEAGSVNPSSPKMTLASLAFQTEMYWSGWVFRGYFNNMSVTESAEKLGLFDYNIEYTVTQKRGLRLNFLPWHRSAVNGPSNSDPAFGTPYSFGSLKRNLTNAVKTNSNIFAKPINKLLKSFRPL